jgi:hypothetical protein
MPAAKKRAPYPEPKLGNIRQIEDGRYKWRDCYSAAPDAATALIEIEAQWLSIKALKTEIADHAESLLPKKVMFVKRDAKLRLGEEKVLTGKGGELMSHGRLHREGETYTFKEDGTGLSTQCIIPADGAMEKKNLDSKLYGAILTEQREAKLTAMRAAAKRANMASRPKDVKELELRRQTPDGKPVYGWGSIEVAATPRKMRECRKGKQENSYKNAYETTPLRAKREITEKYDRELCKQSKHGGSNLLVTAGDCSEPLKERAHAASALGSLRDRNSFST